MASQASPQNPKRPVPVGDLSDVYNCKISRTKEGFISLRGFPRILIKGVLSSTYTYKNRKQVSIKLPEEECQAIKNVLGNSIEPLLIKSPALRNGTGKKRRTDYDIRLPLKAISGDIESDREFWGIEVQFTSKTIVYEVKEGVGETRDFDSITAPAEVEVTVFAGIYDYEDKEGGLKKGIVFYATHFLYEKVEVEEVSPSQPDEVTPDLLWKGVELKF